MTPIENKAFERLLHKALETAAQEKTKYNHRLFYGNAEPFEEFSAGLVDLLMGIVNMGLDLIDPEAKKSLSDSIRNDDSNRIKDDLRAIGKKIGLIKDDSEKPKDPRKTNKPSSDDTEEDSGDSEDSVRKADLGKDFEDLTVKDKGDKLKELHKQRKASILDLNKNAKWFSWSGQKTVVKVKLSGGKEKEITMEPGENFSLSESGGRAMFYKHGMKGSLFISPSELAQFKTHAKPGGKRPSPTVKTNEDSKPGGFLGNKPKKAAESKSPDTHPSPADPSLIKKANESPSKDTPLVSPEHLSPSNTPKKPDSKNKPSESKTANKEDFEVKNRVEYHPDHGKMAHSLSKLGFHQNIVDSALLDATKKLGKNADYKKLLREALLDIRGLKEESKPEPEKPLASPKGGSKSLKPTSKKKAPDKEEKLVVPTKKSSPKKGGTRKLGALPLDE